MNTRILKGALAGLMAVGLSGCMSMGGYGNGYGYDDGYYNDGYSQARYDDRCYDAYEGYDSYYADYDCYDRDDYNSRFSVNIGFGGGWWNDYYYPGYGYYMVDRYGSRRALYGNYLRYWGGRRAGYRWTNRGGRQAFYRNNPGYRRGDGYRGPRSDNGRYRDNRGVGGQIVDGVRRTQRDAAGNGGGDRRDQRRGQRVRTRTDGVPSAAPVTRGERRAAPGRGPRQAAPTVTRPATPRATVPAPRPTAPASSRPAPRPQKARPASRRDPKNTRRERRGDPVQPD